MQIISEEELYREQFGTVGIKGELSVKRWQIKKGARQECSRGLFDEKYEYKYNYGFK